MSLHYLGKLEIRTFYVDIQQIWKEMQTNCILSAPILIPPRVYVECIYVLTEYLKY